MKCDSLTSCLKCENNYILQNKNCIKVCDVGYYSTILNDSANCLACPSNCNSCKINNNILQCTSCSLGFFNENMTCVSTCKIFQFGYHGQCYKCISPCL